MSQRIAEVRRAYAERADEYVELLGRVELLSPVDRAQISAWGRALTGPVLDAGCGPGHWTAHLHGLGVQITGMDLVPAFVARARERFPEVPFREGTLEALPVASGSLAGILSWYSVIHAEPDHLPVLLAEFARCLAPGGSLLLGCFTGPRIAAFPHAVTTAYFWPVDELSRLLEGAGFLVTSVQTRTDPGSRPHAAITAELPVSQ